MARAKPKGRGRFFSRAWSSAWKAEIKDDCAFAGRSSNFASAEVNAPGFRAVLVAQAGDWATMRRPKAESYLKLCLFWDEDTENSREAEITIPLPKSKADLLPLFAELVKDQLEEPEE